MADIDDVVIDDTSGSESDGGSVSSDTPGKRKGRRRLRRRKRARRVTLEEPGRPHSPEVAVFDASESDASGQGDGGACEDSSDGVFYVEGAEDSEEEALPSWDPFQMAEGSERQSAFDVLGRPSKAAQRPPAPPADPEACWEPFSVAEGKKNAFDCLKKGDGPAPRAAAASQGAAPCRSQGRSPRDGRDAPADPFRLGHDRAKNAFDTLMVQGSGPPRGAERPRKGPSGAPSAPAASSYVDCPACGRQVMSKLLNAHLDWGCGASGGPRESLSRGAGAKRPAAKGKSVQQKIGAGAQKRRPLAALAAGEGENREAAAPDAARVEELEALVKELRETIAGVKHELCCVICLCTFEAPMVLPCGHVFCRECMGRALLGRSSCCPLCRVPCHRRDANPCLALRAVSERLGDD